MSAATAVGRRLRVAYWATRAGAADHSAIFTWKSWLFGWFVRMLAQALFFTTAGNLLGPGQARYLLIGNTAVLVAIHGLFATASTTWEVQMGTLPLLVASPGSPSLVLMCRSLFWLPDAVACGLGVVLILGPLVGLPLTWGAVAVVVGLLALVAVTTYCLGLFLGSLVLTASDLRNVVSNAALVVLMILCGPEVPVRTVGTAAGWISDGLPMTHGLLAIRRALAGRLDGHTFVLALQEAGVGLCWLVAAAVVLTWRERRSRRDGAALFLE